jgi:hypothetical protein
LVRVSLQRASSRIDFETHLDGIADAYAAMDERRAIKSLVRIDIV